jgi:hypothetical protein
LGSPEIDHAAFARDGYLVLPDQFSPTEIEDLRARALATRDHRGDQLSNPLLRDFVLDDRILDVARSLLGSPLVYFGESASNFQQSPPMRFHKDNTDRYDSNGPDWRGGYSLIRFGLYLQNQLDYSGGLAVRAGSHRFASRTDGPEVYLGPRAGDLVVWDMRLTHRGRASLYRFVRRPVGTRLDRHLPRFLKAESQTERIAFFLSFGRDDPHLDRYLRYMRTRQWGVDIWRGCAHTPEILEKARAKGVIVRDPKVELARDPVVPVSKKHHQIPY